MATMISNAALIAQAEILKTYIATHIIKYVANGMTLQGMDCQGLAEYLLIQAGVPKKECGLAGSNAHYRACVWTGTPEECIKQFGCIPGGAALFIHAFDGGEPSKYQADGKGNASHMGIVWGKYNSLAASEGRKKVILSNFKGKSINGGWNRVGLMPWVNYGLSVAQKLAAGITEAAAGTASAATTTATTATASVDTTKFYRIEQGSLGGAVERLQTWLGDLGYTLTIDHDFGPATAAAVRQFQSDKGLEADGIVGPKTWAALAEARQTAMTNA